MRKKTKKRSGTLKIIINKMCLLIIDLEYMHKDDLALNNQKLFICHKTQPIDHCQLSTLAENRDTWRLTSNQIVFSIDNRAALEDKRLWRRIHNTSPLSYNQIFCYDRCDRTCQFCIGHISHECTCHQRGPTCIAVVYYSAMIAATRKVHFSYVLFLPSSWWCRRCGWELAVWHTLVIADWVGRVEASEPLTRLFWKLPSTQPKSRYLFSYIEILENKSKIPECSMSPVKHVIIHLWLF